MHNLIVCYSPNAFLRTSSYTAALIVSLLCFWQKGGAIQNFNEGTLNITESEFVNNTALTVSNALCA